MMARATAPAFVITATLAVLPSRSSGEVSGSPTTNANAPPMSVAEKAGAPLLKWSVSEPGDTFLVMDLETWKLVANLGKSQYSPRPRWPYRLDCLVALCVYSPKLEANSPSVSQ